MKRAWSKSRDLALPDPLYSSTFDWRHQITTGATYEIGLPHERLETAVCYEFGSHLERQNAAHEDVTRSPPSKIRRTGSRIMSVLRALTNSVSGTSAEPQAPVSPPAVHRKLSLGFLTPEPTIVHRQTPPNTRPSVLSPSTSTSAERLGESTRMTSLDSKSASSEQKRVRKSTTPDRISDPLLAPIAEIPAVSVPQPVPTIITVEKAAAAKIFFETYYNNLTSGNPTPRELRRRQLEAALYEDTISSIYETDEQRRAWATRETNHLREQRVMKTYALQAQKGGDVTTSRYEIVRILGKGSFGVVRLVRERTESVEKKEIYAMKVIRKSDMLRNSQEGHLRAERDFLVAAEGSRWVIPLIASFQDLNHLYLVMDYMPGGDFLGLLIRDNILTEQVAKWYIAEMILCIEEAHALRWIHRDVKPDNFLISASGHLKISDFGLAFDGHWSHDQAYYNNHRYSLLQKLGINVEGDTIDKKEGKTLAAALQAMKGGLDRHQRRSRSNRSSTDQGILNWRNRHGNRTRARSVVGTSQYMAPEVVKGERYDARCDWWSVAVILYECLYGHTPFLAEEGGRQQTKQNIVDHKTSFAFPSKPSVSRRCQDLIRSIIQDKETRLCSKRYRLRDAGLLPSTTPQASRDHAGRYVFPNDAEDIKCHKWFKDIDWEHLHQTTPPFIPDIKSMDDTHYFDEEDPISDFSESVGQDQPTIEDIADALKPFNQDIQIRAANFIEKPHDSIRLRKIEKEIDTFNVNEDQKDYLKGFVRHYGQKEKKRPRDRLLRDRETAPKVLELRKRGAFLGYTYRRIRREGAGRRRIRLSIH